MTHPPPHTATPQVSFLRAKASPSSEHTVTVSRMGGETAAVHSVGYGQREISWTYGGYQ